MEILILFNMYKCEIIADSLSPQGHRLTSFLVTYPRIVHAEMLRHRMFSRNVASSRAIPFEKMVKVVEENPFIPIAWQSKHSGMQGTEYIADKDEIRLRELEWLKASNQATMYAKHLNNPYGVTKQLCNRLLEPFMWTTELITTSEEGLQNFFDLRCPKYKSEDSPVFKSKKDCIDFINYQGNNVKVEDDEDNMVAFFNGYYDCGTFWCSWLGIIPEYRGSGLSENIMEFLEKEVRLYVNKIWFDTLVDNKEAIKLAEKLGYVKNTRFNNHWYRQDFYIWEKELK